MAEELVKSARKMCGMTLEEAADALDVSVPTLIEYQKNPWNMRMSSFFKFYDAVGTDSKALLKEAVVNELNFFE